MHALSIASMATSTALGTGFSPITATHAPPNAESTIRLRSSAR